MSEHSNRQRKRNYALCPGDDEVRPHEVAGLGEGIGDGARYAR